MQAVFPVLAFVLSFAICFLIARISRNLWMILAIVIILQASVFVWMVEKEQFFASYSILNIAIFVSTTFIWYMVAAQMHLAMSKTENGASQ